MRKLVHKILKGVSLTAALFVFQACYGTPIPDPGVVDEEVSTELSDDTGTIDEDTPVAYGSAQE